MKKVVFGMVIMFVLQIGWSWHQKEATAQQTPIIEVVASSFSGDYDRFDLLLGTYYQHGYRVKGFHVTQNSKGQFFKHAIMELP